MTDSLEIRVLGPFEVMADGRPADVGGSKRQGLLALLALRGGHVVGVDALIDALWGEELPAAPRNALHHHIARLRAALGQESIIATTDGYALKDATVDAVRFEELLGDARAALREGDPRGGAETVALALAIWRGPALHGLTDTTWFAAEARRLEALRVDALEEQFEAALALGDHREIVSELRATLAENPFRERLWGQLMLALYRSGRQADALETFQEARAVLADELGLEPGPELRGIQQAILAQDPAIATVPEVSRRRGNLPAPSTSFVGREQELAQVLELLREHRLVTLTGPPGVGKTRLALEAARVLESEIRDGVWVVDLARAGSADDLTRLVAQAVDARGADPLARVVARLRDGDAVVVFDACEHVIEGVGPVVGTVLAQCPGVRVLATSREVLRVAGEIRVRVEPLPLADAESPDVVDSPAVELFVARARAARPGFELTADAASVIAEISRLVDGLPLAIELAAARVNVLGLAELLSLVERRLTLLRERPASDVSRAALETLVEWSYDLLHADEKTLLHQVAVHRGGASLASLIAAGGSHGLDEGTVTYLLGTLVDKSIVSVSFPSEDACYDVLDTVRDYALQRLAESGDLAAARKAHAEYFAAFCDSARVGLRGRDWLSWVKRLELENENLWAALSYARGADPGLAMWLAAGSALYFVLAERVSEARRFLETALSCVPEDAPVELRLELVAFLCYIATEELDPAAGIAVGEPALALAAGEASKRSLGLLQGALGLAFAYTGDEQRASALAEEGHATVLAEGDEWSIAVCSLLRAQVAARAGDLSMVAAMAAEADRFAGAVGFDAFQVPAALLEAWVAERHEDGETAAKAYRRTIELAERTGFDDHAAFALARLGSSALAGGDLRQAETLERRALAGAEAAHADWTAAYARAELGRVLHARGEVDTAERLFRNVLEWEEGPRLHQARETLFVALAGSPATIAQLGLAEIVDGHGDRAPHEAVVSD